MMPADFSRFPAWRRWFGRRSERFAARYLRRLGWRVLAWNVADRRGEMDLLALDGRTLVVVEVRSSADRSHDELAASVDWEKRRRLTRAILRFLHRRRLENVAVRFDILTLRWPPGQAQPDARLYRHAFEMTGKYQMHS